VYGLSGPGQTRGSLSSSHASGIVRRRIESIAEECGYSGEEQMRATFVRVLKIPPREYRKRFATSKRPAM
jgi:AraC-like DNA-binding protein